MLTFTWTQLIYSSYLSLFAILFVTVYYGLWFIQSLGNVLTIGTWRQHDAMWITARVNWRISNAILCNFCFVFFFVWQYCCVILRWNINSLTPDIVYVTASISLQWSQRSPPRPRPSVGQGQWQSLVSVSLEGLERFVPPAWVWTPLFIHIMHRFCFKTTVLSSNLLISHFCNMVS